uniref:Glutathione S-transferase n=1 Tax=Anisakis simplex TaxID=6269 RepID=A0A0M3JET3_ANISI
LRSAVDKLPLVPSDGLKYDIFLKRSPVCCGNRFGQHENDDGKKTRRNS